MPLPNISGLNYTNLTHLIDHLGPENSRICIYPVYSQWILINMALLSLALIFSRFNIAPKLKITSENTFFSREINNFLDNFNEKIVNILFSVNFFLFGWQILIPLIFEI